MRSHGMRRCVDTGMRRYGDASIRGCVYSGESANGLVAQWIERSPPERKVVGSNPIKPTNDPVLTGSGRGLLLFPRRLRSPGGRCATFVIAGVPIGGHGGRMLHRSCSRTCRFANMTGANAAGRVRNRPGSRTYRGVLRRSRSQSRSLMACRGCPQRGRRGLLRQRHRYHAGRGPYAATGGDMAHFQLMHR